jgi:transglutaminase-like putative cysteine protease
MGIAVAANIFAAAVPIASEPLADVIAMIDAGQFQRAQTTIDKTLKQAGLDDAQRHALAFQSERMRRIRLDFDLDAKTVQTQLRKSIPDLRNDEFAHWAARGYIEHRIIDGETRYFHRAASNLFRLSAAARARRAQPIVFDDPPLEQAGAYHAQVRDSAISGGKSSVAPQRVRVTQSLTVNADAVPAGKTIRAWIPYPQVLPGQQEDIRFVASVPATHVIASESAPQRTVYLEKSAQAGKPTTFSITYEVTVFAQFHAVDATKVVPATITPELAPFVAERPPHIVFTQPMRLFSQQIVGDEKNPWRIAQKLFAAVDAIPWAGAREYSTITNISNHALHAGHADCGQQTLLLMTLLRMNGIPTRWQSGAIFSDAKYWDIHDWGWLYIAPYGWMPMDVTFGRLDSTDPGIAGFYLGGLDGFRLAFNRDYGQALQPAKKFFRSDNVDSQRGEVEWSGGNLYFNQWDYDFQWHFVPTNSSSKRQP